MAENPYEPPRAISWSRTPSSKGRHGMLGLLVLFAWLAGLVIGAPDEFRLLAAIVLLAATTAFWYQFARQRDLPRQVIGTFMALSAVSVSFAGYLIATVF